MISDDTCDWAVQFEYEVKDNCGNYYEGVVKVTYWGSDQSAPYAVDTLPAGASGINACIADALQDNPPVDGDAIIKLFEDDCDDKLQARSALTVVDDSCKWEFYYTYYVWDDCQNVYEFKQHFSGEDNVAPVLVGEIPMDMSDIDSCKDDAPDGPSEGEISQLFHDSCGVNVDRTVFSTGDDCNWLYSYEYDVYDNCGNHYQTFKITYQGGDQTAPTFECPEDADFGVDETPVYATGVSGIEDCSDTSTQYADSNHATNPGDPYTVLDNALVIDLGYGYNAVFDLQTTDGTYNNKSVYVGTLYYGTNESIYSGEWTYRARYYPIYGGYWKISEYHNGYYYGAIARGGGQGSAPTCNTQDYGGSFPRHIIGPASCSLEKATLVHSFTRTFTVTDECDNSDSCDVNYSWAETTKGVNDADLAPFGGAGDQDGTEFDEESGGSSARGGDVELDFTAYPVPFKERVNVRFDFDFDTPVKIEVFDTKGLLVLSKEANHRAGDLMDLPLEIARNTDQLYYVKITTNQGTITKKVLSSTVKR